MPIQATLAIAISKHLAICSEHTLPPIPMLKITEEIGGEKMEGAGKLWGKYTNYHETREERKIRRMK